MNRPLSGAPAPPRRRARWLGAVLAALCLAGVATPAPPARAATDPVAVAEQLHQKATEAYKAKQLKRAIELWREAHDTHAVWKYAYNLANALREDGQYVQAWDYVGKAEALGVPADFAAYLLELRSFIRAELTKDHALLTLELDPPDAHVTRNGAVWPAPPADPESGAVPPREVWTKDTESKLAISKEGYISQEVAWRHGVGVHERRMTLRPVPKPGTLMVGGTPVGAEIVLDDDAVGSIPDLALPVAPGPHVLVARAPGYVSERRPITIESERELRVDFALKPVVAPPSPSDLATPGWVAVGSGAALLAAGAGFLLWADETAADIRALNESAAPPTPYEDYANAYGDLKSDFDLRRDAGTVLVALGAAAAITGVVLVVIDATSAADEPRATVLPVATHISVSPISGGMAMTAGVRF